MHVCLKISKKMSATIPQSYMHNVAFFMARRALNAAETESAPWTHITTCAVM